MWRAQILCPSERGTVLLCALMVITLVAMLGAAVALIVSSESAVAANYHASQQGLYAADAGIERAIAELRTLPAWTAVPSSATSFSDFNDSQATPQGPDGSTLNLAQMTVRRQAESDALYASVPGRPVWRLYAHAPLNRMVPGTGNATPYVVVWIADDPDEGDGNAAVDSNDVVMLHAEAFTVRRGKRAIEATIRREEAMAAGMPGVMRTDVSVIAWHEVLLH
jgi:type II secretory pathway pseudopilin PulG